MIQVELEPPKIIQAFPGNTVYLLSLCIKKREPAKELQNTKNFNIIDPMQGFTSKATTRLCESSFSLNEEHFEFVNTAVLAYKESSYLYYESQIPTPSDSTPFECPMVPSGSSIALMSWDLSLAFGTFIVTNTSHLIAKIPRIMEVRSPTNNEVTLICLHSSNPKKSGKIHLFSSIKGTYYGVFQLMQSYSFAHIICYEVKSIPCVKVQKKPEFETIDLKKRPINNAGHHFL